MSKLAPGHPDVSASGEKAVPARLSEVAACNVRTAARLVAPGNRYDGFQRRGTCLEKRHHDSPFFSFSLSRERVL